MWKFYLNKSPFHNDNNASMNVCWEISNTQML